MAEFGVQTSLLTTGAFQPVLELNMLVLGQVVKAYNLQGELLRRVDALASASLTSRLQQQHGV
eukprot:1500868-Amphidinium_carterae.2